LSFDWLILANHTLKAIRKRSEIYGSSLPCDPFRIIPVAAQGQFANYGLLFAAVARAHPALAGPLPAVAGRLP
jgi:hypothetical protein